jgi:hypothetical protein
MEKFDAMMTESQADLITMAPDDVQLCINTVVKGTPVFKKRKKQ